MKTLLLAVALVLVAGNGNPRCPRDGSDSMWTGKSGMTKSPPAQMVYEYSCFQWQHKFWSVDAPGTVR